MKQEGLPAAYLARLGEKGVWTDALARFRQRLERADPAAAGSAHAALLRVLAPAVVPSTIRMPSAYALGELQPPPDDVLWDLEALHLLNEAVRLKEPGK